MTDWVRIKNTIFRKDLIQAVKLKHERIKSAVDPFTLSTIEVMLNGDWILASATMDDKEKAEKLLSDIENQLKKVKNEP